MVQRMLELPTPQLIIPDSILVQHVVCLSPVNAAVSLGYLEQAPDRLAKMTREVGERLFALPGSS